MNKNQCNICGANYEYVNGKWKCPACGAYKQEELSNEEATLLYNAAQKLRVQEFDDAEESYLDIIQKYPKQHEAYWGYVCSHYGIKMEEDFNGKRIPTCCFPSIDSFIKDKNYKKALEYAPEDKKAWYMEKAEYIERVRKEWVEKVKGEEAYDIFISYKDSDVINGIERTRDSINALELYNHLARQGYNVFYSRESLRDKIGEKYEPYIFNALNTSKVMILYGSSVDYINSTWVKNEWHRYLKKIENGEKRDGSLLVVCDGFSPNELPSVLAKKQCLDAKARSFYTDLDNRIKELVKNPKVERGSIRKYKVEKINVEELVPAKKQEIKQFDAIHEHNFKKVQVVPPTCNSQGYTLFRCDCGEEKKTDFTPKRTSHEWQLAERKEPTCINNGYELYECKYCDATDKKILTATGHDEFVAEEKEATCFEEGYRKYECKICGHTRFEPISKTNHEYGDWVITKHPTCVENGEETRQCKNCPDQQKRELPAEGHSFSKWVVKTEPTCDKEGIEHRQCKTCGKIEERSLPKRQHKFSTWQNSKDGKYKERICEYCGKVDKLLTEEYANKKKASKLEIISYVLFGLAGISLLIGTIIFFANCYDIGILAYTSWKMFIPFLVGIISWITALGLKAEVKKLTKKSFIYKSLLGKVLSIVLIVSLSCWWLTSNVFLGLRPTDGYADGYYYNYYESGSGIVLEGSQEELSGDIIVPTTIDGNTVVGIGKLFYQNNKITSITIPDSVISIGDDAFYKCTSLTSIEIPNSVTSIGDYAFYGCPIENATIPTIAISYIPKSTLKTVIITGGESIGSSAFYKCTSLTSIVLPNSVTSIGDWAFYYCNSLTSVVIGNSVTSIGDYAFEYCSSLTSIEIPNRVTSIGSSAFYKCTSLTSIALPNSVTSIGSSAFYKCTSLTSIALPNSVTSIGNTAFWGCSSLTNIEIPDSVTSIGDWAFYYCSSLTSIVIPNSVTSIGDWAFYSCDSLTSIEIPNSVTSIGSCAFSGCSSLTSIVIPDSVTSIGYSAFCYCDKLTIYCELESQPGGWDLSWNYSSRPVIWGYKGE